MPPPSEREASRNHSERTTEFFMIRPGLLTLSLVIVLGFVVQPVRLECPLAPTRAHAQPQPQILIHINTATLAELDSLPGIGPSKAAAIIAARERRPFRRLQDLLRVPGIGRATLERLAPFLAFDVPDSPRATTPHR